MPYAQPLTPRDNSTNRERGSLVFHIGTCHLRVHSHERSERETGPEPGNRSKSGFIAGNILKGPSARSTSSCRTKATEPKQPRRYNGSRGQIWSLHTNRFVIPTHAQALLSLSLAPSETPANLRKGGASALSGANKKHRQVLISGHRPKQEAHIQQDRCEKHAVKPVKNSTVAREKLARVLETSQAFEHRLAQVSCDAPDSEYRPHDDAVKL